jgi:hypothetical protein
MLADQGIDAGASFRSKAVVSDGGDETVSGGVPGQRWAREREQHG